MQICAEQDSLQLLNSAMSRNMEVLQLETTKYRLVGARKVSVVGHHNQVLDSQKYLGWFMGHT